MGTFTIDKPKILIVVELRSAHELIFGLGMSPKGLGVKGLVLSHMLLEDSGDFERLGLVQGL